MKPTTDNRYYKPAIEELHVGYQAEACFTSYGGYMIWNGDGTTEHHEPEDKEAAKHWSPYTIEEQKGNPLEDNIQRSMDTAIMILKDGRLRSKHLDKQDIESCGWIIIQGDYYRLEVKEIGYNLSQGPGIDEIEIQEWGQMIYRGKCKSINELRLIMKWVGIK